MQEWGDYQQVSALHADALHAFGVQERRLWGRMSEELQLVCSRGVTYWLLWLEHAARTACKPKFIITNPYGGHVAAGFKISPGKKQKTQINSPS